VKFDVQQESRRIRPGRVLLANSRLNHNAV
jgi:hypothetical protein